ncbi:hypothetical protein JCM18237_01880 [Halorubrum luteum]
MRWRAPRAGQRPASREGDRREPSDANGEAVSERARETGGAAERFRRPLRSRLGWSEAAVRGGTGRGSREGDARRRKDRKERTQ